MKPTELLAQRLGRGEIIIVDGGMGTEIEARGVEMDDAVWCALANVDHPDVVESVHVDYLRAGADVIIANTFPAGRPTLEAAGHGARFEEINRAAVASARHARDRAGRAAVIAGAIGGLPTATDMSFFERGLSDEELRDAFGAQARLLADAGVDLIALEMIGPGSYGRPAVEGAREAGLPIWLGLSVLRIGGDGEHDYGTLADDADRAAFDAVVSSLAGDDLAAVTVMHSHLVEVLPAFEAVGAHWSGTLGAYPHVGTFHAPHWEFEDITPETYLREAQTWVDHGARLVGGCCGIRPEHIAALSTGLRTPTAT
jgi:homocysteine S-methyltransferase